MREWVLLVALVVVAPSCSDVRAELRDVREEIARFRPLLPEPAGLAADGISLLIALLAHKSAQSARRRATRSNRENHGKAAR